PWLAESSPRRQPTALHTGDPLVIPPGLGAPAATLVHPGYHEEKLELSAEHNTFVKDTQTAGLYRLKDLPAPAVERLFAVNLASRSESDNAARQSVSVGGLKLDS